MTKQHIVPGSSNFTSPIHKDHRHSKLEPTMYILQTMQLASNRVEALYVETLPRVYVSWRKQRGLRFVPAFREFTYSKKCGKNSLFLP